jgi:hypothetical protein
MDEYYVMHKGRKYIISSEQHRMLLHLSAVAYERWVTAHAAVVDARELETKNSAGIVGPTRSSENEPKVADSVEATLAQRGSRYGDFTDHAGLAQGLMFRLQKFNKPADNEQGYTEPWRDNLNDVQRQALTVIVDKIARILSGDPNYDDNWHDIQGYAKLVEDRLPKKSEN